MGLRAKILAGFLILAVMLAVAGVWSIYEFSQIGDSVRKILDDNYRSISAAREMTEALERQDSGVLLLQLGYWSEGRDIINQADSVFNANLKFACENVTVPGEPAVLDSIRFSYARYKLLWEKPIVDTEREGNLEWYFTQMHRSFLAVKKSVNDLSSLNDRTMYETASDLRQKASRAIMPGIVAIIGALFFTLIFNTLINRLVISPIVNITRTVKAFRKTKKPFQLHIRSHDELLDLAEAIRELTDLELSRNISNEN